MTTTSEVVMTSDERDEAVRAIQRLVDHVHHATSDLRTLGDAEKADAFARKIMTARAIKIEGLSILFVWEEA